MTTLATTIDKNKNKLVLLLKKFAKISLKSLSLLSNLQIILKRALKGHWYNRKTVSQMLYSAY